MAASSSGSRGPGIYIILTSRVPEENGIQEAAKGEHHHGYQFTALNFEGVFLSVSSSFLVVLKIKLTRNGVISRISVRQNLGAAIPFEGRGKETFLEAVLPWQAQRSRMFVWAE